MEEGRFKACSSGGAFFIFTTDADAAPPALHLAHLLLHLRLHPDATDPRPASSFARK